MRKFLNIASFAGFLLFAASSALFGQATSDPNSFLKAIDFLPPPPNAAAMVKHDEITVSKNTGVASINVPIFSVKGHKLSTSVALNYSSSGIKVDEIASQVGMGWSLQAGGVVTRTVRGTPDELNTRINAPAAGISDHDTASYHFLYHVAVSDVNSGEYDSEPDLFNFSFGGYSGSFVFDTAMNVVQIHASPVKIAFDFTSTDWTFKITDPQGVKYYFGGGSATDKTKKDQTCGKLFDTYVSVAWHLIKIEHPNGESILFSYTPVEYVYDTGIAQTQTYGSQAVPSGGYPEGTCANTPCVVPGWVNCEHLLHTQGYILTDIILPGNCDIAFSYTDRLDYQYGKLINQISLYDKVDGNSALVSSWALTYNQQQADMTYPHRTASYTQYTPYLVSAVQSSPDGTINLPYYFTYNDPGGRPCRMSYAQDHWGYFNGVKNLTLIPPPTKVEWKQWFPQATADRSPDVNYTIKGMLSKVTYPTGGMDSMVYEANVVSSPTNDVFYTQHRMDGSVTGTGFKTTVESDHAFSISAPQTVHVNISCIDNSGTGDFDPVHNVCRFEILDHNGSQFVNVLQPGQSSQADVQVMDGSCTINTLADGSVATGTFSLYFLPTATGASHPSATPLAGLRIREILTANPGQKAMLKHFYYGELNSPDVSSMAGVDIPSYEKDMATRYFCQNGPFGTVYYYLFCSYWMLTSSTSSNLFDYQSYPVSYASVIESHGGDNFENGGVQTHFFSSPDTYGPTMWGSDLFFGAWKSNFSSYFNGKVKDEMVFKKASDQSIVPLTKKVFTYNIDSRLGKSVPGFTVNHPYYDNVIPAWDCQFGQNTCTYDYQLYMGGFDVTRYDVFSSWVYNDSSTEYMYSGNTTLSNTTRNYFDDAYNLQLSRTETYDSKGNLIKTYYKYPDNFAGQAVYDSMTARNIVTPVVDIEKDKGLIKQSETRSNFTNWGNGNFEPSSFQVAYGSGNLQDLGTITKYDGCGNILEYTGRDGITTSVIWGFGNLYPVAKIAGAGYDQARALLTVDTAQLNTLSGTSLLNQLNLIRQGLAAAQVTTYDFKPQTGVLSVTDLNNSPSYYDYDAFRRLMGNRDKDGNVVKQIDYHYVHADPNASFTIYMNTAGGITLAPTSCIAGYTAPPGSFSVPAGKYFSVISVDDANKQRDAEINAYAQDFVNKDAVCTLNTTP